jgi:hypothetical protein
VMLIYLAAAIGFEMADKADRAERDAQRGGFIFEPRAEAIGAGFAIPAIGLIPVMAILDDPFPPIDRWWVYVADVASIWCVWSFIGLLVDMWKARASAGIVRIDFRSKD